MGPAADKRGVRKSNVFIPEEWPFADKGILINHHVCDVSDVCHVCVVCHVCDGM